MGGLIVLATKFTHEPATKFHSISFGASKCFTLFIFKRTISNDLA